MRNKWYPTKKAEFMTDARLKELGLSKNDVGERDPMFGMQIEIEEELVEDAVEAVAGLPKGAVALNAGAGQASLESPSHTPAVEIEHVAVGLPWMLKRRPRPFLLDDTLLTERRSIYSPTAPLNSSPP